MASRCGCLRVAFRSEVARWFSKLQMPLVEALQQQQQQQAKWSFFNIGGVWHEKKRSSFIGVERGTRMPLDFGFHRGAILLLRNQARRRLSVALLAAEFE